MLKEGSVLPDNTASAHEANKPSSVDCGPNERGEDDCPRIQALPRVIETGHCATGYGEEAREWRQKQIFCVYNIRKCGCCSNCIYLQASFSWLHSVLHAHTASMQTYSLPLPIHSSPNTRILWHTQHYRERDRSMVVLKQKAVGSWTIWRAISQDNSTRWWCTLNVSMRRDSRQTAAYTIRCTSQTWRCSCHLFEVAVRTLRLTAIENDMGAKLTMNGDTCNVPKSSHQGPCLRKNVLQ